MEMPRNAPSSTSLRKVGLAYLRIVIDNGWIILREVLSSSKWLQRLGYGAESRSKVVSLRMGFAMGRLENSGNGYLFRIREG